MNPRRITLQAKPTQPPAKKPTDVLERCRAAYAVISKRFKK